MANPSTGFGGAGTEVLRRKYIDGGAESESTVLLGVANHIMTIISIIIQDRSMNADAVFDLYIDADLAGSDVYLAYAQSCGLGATYVWNDRFAITETDKVIILPASASGTAQYDVWCTYIDQQLA
jgi:hypothetical protein